MARYIDADLLMKEFSDFVRPSNNSDFEPVPIWNDAVSLVGSAPTADVRENVRGEWIIERGRVVRCSNCKAGFGTKVGVKNATTYDFCPNCGADMRGGEN